ncbi:hypothetical protein H0H93_003969, partial [Arthromyces matolae]
MSRAVSQAGESLTLKVEGACMEVDRPLFTTQSRFWAQWLANNGKGKDVTARIDGLDVSDVDTLLNVLSHDSESAIEAMDAQGCAHLINAACAMEFREIERLVCDRVRRAFPHDLSNWRNGPEEHGMRCDWGGERALLESLEDFNVWSAVPGLCYQMVAAYSPTWLRDNLVDQSILRTTLMTAQQRLMLLGREHTWGWLSETSPCGTGLGGEANWNSHTESAAHKKNDLAPRNQTITSFFSQKSHIPPSSQNPTPLVPRLKSTLPPPLAFPDDAGSMVDVPPDLMPSSSGNLNEHASSSSTSISHVEYTRRLALNLPDNVPVATKDDWLSQFVSDPHWDTSEHDSAWEMMEAVINYALGYDAKLEAITPLIRRGGMGVEALCDWLAKCTIKYGVDECLYEGKLKRLDEAMKTLGASYNDVSIAIVENIPRSPLHLAPSLSHNTTVPAVSVIEHPCAGYHLITPPGNVPHASYPFLLHHTRELPWDITITKNKIVLRSHDCTETVFRPSSSVNTGPETCRWCLAIHNHHIVMGIRHRAVDGAHENTPWAYLTPTQMYSALERKTQQVNLLKLNGLNMGKKLGVRNHQIEGWKRLSMAIANEDIPRISALMRVETRKGHSVYSILEKIDMAARRAYNPHGYEKLDYERAFLILKLGGRAAAEIAHRALGIPSITTIKRHISSSPIQASSGLPTTTEMSHNLDICLRSDGETRDHRRVIGMTIQVDEIKIQERLRWDPSSNLILGVCREHGSQCALEFRTIHQADVVQECLRSERIHLASEATVIAVSVLTNNPMDYSASPFVISPSCKRETVEQQETLLRSASEAVIRSQKCNGRRLYSIASDGDSRRRQALISIAVHCRLSPDSPIYHLLAPLRLFDSMCGEDALTADFDWKHVLKRFRNTLLRLKGFTIDGIPISRAILEVFLERNGVSLATIDHLLQPNDRQDVVLMVKLLHSISIISRHVSSDEQPTTQSTRRVLFLLGRLYHHFLQAYLNVDLSLNEQLVHLSAAAHLILALYNLDKGDFIPVQLFFDAMSMIKNIYFCVAKTQVDNPGGQFWLILMGTDGLEKVFGLVRTMIGSDSNADQYQLANRIGGAVQCANILADHPEWGGQSRRLTLKTLSNNPDEISSKYDHINPKTLRGNLFVSSVVLSGCWQSGRRHAEDELKDADISPPFDWMEARGGYNILSPFGDNKIVLIHGKVDVGEQDEIEEEQDIVQGSSETDEVCQVQGVDDGEELEPDLDDIAGYTEISQQLERDKNYAWVSLSDSLDNPNRASQVHKASVLRLYSNSFATPNSKDRLRRVRGFSQFSPMTPSCSSNSQTSPNLDDHIVCVQDPALTLVRCCQKLFLAVIEIQGITVGGIEVRYISAERISEPNVQISGQVLRIALVNAAHQTEQPDWEWLGSYEQKSGFRGACGYWFELVDPTLRKAERGRRTGKDTYAFKSTDLRASAALLHQRIGELGDLTRLPELPQSNSFPYRATDGSACFACEHDTISNDPSISTHPTANKGLYQDLYSISPEERVLMKSAFLTVPRPSKKRPKGPTLAISEAYSTRMTFRDLDVEALDGPNSSMDVNDIISNEVNSVGNDSEDADLGEDDSDYEEREDFTGNSTMATPK